MKSIFNRAVCGAVSAAMAVGSLAVTANLSGEINLKDVVLLRRYIAGGWGVKLK